MQRFGASRHQPRPTAECFVILGLPRSEVTLVSRRSTFRSQIDQCPGPRMAMVSSAQSSDRSDGLMRLADHPMNPMALFCARPQGRIDDAVNQGLNLLAGLALGGSVNGRGIDQR